MTSSESISFKCIPLAQPIGTFYTGVMSASDVIEISWVDVQRIEKRELDSFFGIERPLRPDRVEELAKYVNTVDATFPTSILLAVSSEDAQYHEDSGIMTVTRGQRVAKVIDGQHRIEGLKAFSDGQFEVNVTLFVDMDIADQAMVFATINLKQMKVSKSIAYNLYEYATTRSPHKTAHDIAKLLNGKDGSPFKDKIKILGTATPGKEHETLTQAAFVDQLVDLISEDPDADRDTLKRRRTLKKASPELSRKLVFRNMFIHESDAEIAAVVWNYFSAVQQKWPRAWTATERGFILNRTTGFAALMRLLPIAYMSLGDPGDVASEDQFYSVFKGVSLKDSEFTSTKYVPGSTGPKDLFEDLLQQTGLG